MLKVIICAASADREFSIWAKFCLLLSIRHVVRIGSCPALLPTAAARPPMGRIRKPPSPETSSMEIFGVIFGDSVLEGQRHCFPVVGKMVSVTCNRCVRRKKATGTPSNIVGDGDSAASGCCQEINEVQGFTCPSMQLAAIRWSACHARTPATACLTSSPRYRAD